MEEEWKPIPGYEKYAVSNLGRVKHIKKNSIRVVERNSRGYARIRLQIKKVFHRLMIHRCVAKAFIPNPENKPFCDHIDHNPANNRLDNLRWTTRSENMLNTKMRANKTATRHKNIIKQGKRFRWKITVNGVIHRSDLTYETEELAYSEFLSIVKSLSPYASTPAPMPIVVPV